MLDIIHSSMEYGTVRKAAVITDGVGWGEGGGETIQRFGAKHGTQSTLTTHKQRAHDTAKRQEETRKQRRAGS